MLGKDAKKTADLMDKSFGRIESKLDEFQATLKALKPAKNWKEYLD